MTEIERLRKKLKKANDDYHEAVDEVMLSNILGVEHKCKIGAKAKVAFELMSEIYAFPLKEKE